MFDPMTLRPTGDAEPPAFHILNDGAPARALLICDHASNALPRGYGSLGIAEEKMFEHIAWDVGAAAVTRRLSELLDAPAILAGLSRLFVDLNRYSDDPTCIASFSDGTVVHGNENLGDNERAHRLAAHQQYHDEVARRIAAMSRPEPPVLLFIHSFTPRIGGTQRPWHLGVLHDGQSAESRRLVDVLRADPEIAVGDNQPYSVDDPKSYSIYEHAIDAGRPYIALEIRQDLIETEEAADRWAVIIARAFREALAPNRAFPEQTAA
ncbi:N-formylglutamate amidohydrolase [Minwuia thermotolerans]|uniref:N-formylglutamate amidohydrolase n=2 Tax=Minwuia thermotolerans TaxID=2056226 RepID=A0A2M9G2T5_9PROT|nr:N-formylglutamate amidohydrolase [Minwuia thermotolerans]